MSACEMAYEYLNARYTGGYVQLVQDILDAGGVLMQDPSAFLAAVMRGEECYVVFGCGDVERMMQLAAACAPVYGYTRVRWERQICGKRRTSKIYTIEQLRRYAK